MTTTDTDTDNVVTEYGDDVDTVEGARQWTALTRWERAEEPREPRPLGRALSLPPDKQAWGLFLVPGRRDKELRRAHLGGPRTTGGGELAAFRAWWQTQVGCRPGSSKCTLETPMAWRLWRLVRSGAYVGQGPPWTNVRVGSMRGWRAHRRVASALHGYARRVRSRSGLTCEAPAWLACAHGADIRRLSRLSPGFLRWLARRHSDAELRGRGGRVDWAVMARLAAEFRAVLKFRVELQTHRVPMSLWSARLGQALRDAPPARAEEILDLLRSKDRHGRPRMIPGADRTIEVRIALGERPVDLWPGLLPAEAHRAWRETITGGVAHQPPEGVDVPFLLWGIRLPLSTRSADVGNWMLACCRDPRRRAALLRERQGPDGWVTRYVEALGHVVTADLGASGTRASVADVVRRAAERIRSEQEERILQAPEVRLAPWPGWLPRTLPVGWRWLDSERAALREGLDLGHCAGLGARMYATRGQVLLSLADGAGRSTLRVGCGQHGRAIILEHRAVRNSAPPPAHTAAIAAWLGAS